MKRNLFITLVLIAFCAPALQAQNWTWMKGSTNINQYGVYTTSTNVTAADLTPGIREDAVSWTDNSGDLWLFGGSGWAVSSVGYLNDLWKYSNGNWTWMDGSNTTNQVGVYTSSAAPGARKESVAWIDGAGDLWLFGGYGYDASSSGYLNDLWKYSNGNWTWMEGSNTKNQLGVYGIKGTAAAANTPGSRYGSVSWTDNNGDLWLFGGSGYSSSSQDFLNDLWKYSNGNWTWMKGTNWFSEAGVYGIKGTAAAANTPGSRYGSVSWTDNSGILWLFGGKGLDQTNTYGKLNDLWRFDVPNYAPLADAGADQTIEGTSPAGAAVTLDGSGSSDPDNDVLTYSWKEGLTEFATTETAPVTLSLGTHTIDLTVTDPDNATDTDQIIVTVTDNTAPVVSCKNVTVTLVNTTVSITADDVDNGTTDACSAFTLSVSPSTFTSAGTYPVTLTATDVYNNTSPCTATVTVIASQTLTPTITVTNSPAIPGGAANTVYLGYAGAETVTLTVTGVPSGTTYSWSPATNLSCTDCAAPVLSPTAEGSYAYTVTATDGNNTGTASVTIDVVDWRCGNNLNKVTVCHNGRTICIASSALPAHLALGDYLGGCTAPKLGATVIPAEFTLSQNFPNPFNPSTTITFGVPEEGNVRLNVYDLFGRLVAIPTAGNYEAGTHTVQFDGHGLTSGMYVYQLEWNGGVKAKKMTLLK